MRSKSFNDSQGASFRRLVRDAIRKGPFTRSQRDVTLVVINHWFKHKDEPKGYVNLTRKLIAEKSRCSLRTVASSLAMLRAAFIIYPAYEANASDASDARYVVDIMSVLTLCGCDWVDEFRPFPVDAV